MDRIDTFQDLLKLLDSKPEWVAELRARLLTPELLALPEQLARFVETANKRFDALESGMRELRADVRELKTGVSDLKGYAVPQTARRMVGKIAEVTNCRRPRWVEATEIIDIADEADTTEVPPNEVESFRAIDLALKAVNKTTGEPFYVIVECSYTVDANDVERAQRNAEYMTQFTGVPTQAVVMGDSIPDGVSRIAEQVSVACITITNKSARPR